MRSTIIIAALTAVLALPVALAPSHASASCDGRKNTGMAIGGIGGALVGNAVSKGSTGTIIGGLGGAVVGHQIAKSGCAPRRTAYRTVTRTRYAEAQAPRAPVRKVYYDQYGNPVGSATTTYR